MAVYCKYGDAIQQLDKVLPANRWSIVEDFYLFAVILPCKSFLIGGE